MKNAFGSEGQGKLQLGKKKRNEKKMRKVAKQGILRKPRKTN